MGYIAGNQQKCTQSGGTRPFGISTLVIGLDSNGIPRLYQTDPSGNYNMWKAAAIGRNSEPILKYLEKNYRETTGAETLTLALQALMVVLKLSSETVEIAILETGRGLKIIDDD